jgi:hypothetical protein
MFKQRKVVKFFFTMVTVHPRTQLFELVKQYEIKDFHPQENIKDFNYQGSLDYKQSRQMGSLYVVADGKLVQFQRNYTGK